MDELLRLGAFEWLFSPLCLARGNDKCIRTKYEPAAGESEGLISAVSNTGTRHSSLSSGQEPESDRTRMPAITTGDCTSQKGRRVSLPIK